MTTLEDRLAALADDAPLAEASPGLWERGQSLHRRRRRGTVAIVAAAVVALSVLGVTSWRLADAEPAPAAPGDGLRLPDRFFTPSAWLPGTDDDGPIGRLTAVVGAERADGWSGTTSGIAGVSATGEYRFLDLPGLHVEEMAGFPILGLSADGRRIAYWYGGEKSSVEGVAVYDTTSGEVDRLPFDSNYGLASESLVWSGDQLWFEVWRNRDATGSSATGYGSRIWDLGSGEVIVHSRTTDLNDDATPFANGLVSGSGRGLSFYEPHAPRPVRKVRLDRPVQASPVFAGDGIRFAALEDVDGPSTVSDVPGQLLLGRLGDDGDVPMTEVPGVETNMLLGWRDASHLVVQTYAKGADYYSVDIRTGESERLSAPAPMNWWPGTGVARDAWAAPVFDAPEPPSPMDPHLQLRIGLGVVAVAGLALVLWRRRVRP